MRLHVFPLVLLATPALAGNDDSAQTVGQGRVQVESEIVTWSDRGDEPGSMALNLEAGLTERLDVQLVRAPLHDGETTLRLKLNLWGNAEGTTALALAPSIGFPAAADGLDPTLIDCGIAVPLSVSLPAVELGVLLELHALRDAAGALTPAVCVTATAGRPLVGPLEGSVEWSTTWSEGERSQELRLGLSLAIGDALALDLGGAFTLPGAALIGGFTLRR